MAGRRTRAVDSRVYSDDQLAQMFGRSVDWFRPHRERKLYPHGFPRPDPLLDGTDVELVHDWFDRRGGRTTQADQVGTDRAALLAEFEDVGAARSARRQ